MDFRLDLNPDVIFNLSEFAEKKESNFGLGFESCRQRWRKWQILIFYWPHFEWSFQFDQSYAIAFVLTKAWIQKYRMHFSRAQQIPSANGHSQSHYKMCVITSTLHYYYLSVVAIIVHSKRTIEKWKRISANGRKRKKKIVCTTYTYTHRVHITVFLVPEHLLRFSQPLNSSDEWMRTRNKM